MGAGDPGVLDFAEAGRPGGYALELDGLFLFNSGVAQLIPFSAFLWRVIIALSMRSWVTSSYESRKEWVTKAQRAEVASHLH